MTLHRRRAHSPAFNGKRKTEFWHPSMRARAFFLGRNRGLRRGTEHGFCSCCCLGRREEANILAASAAYINV